jgi:hypothetical protein
MRKRLLDPVSWAALDRSRLASCVVSSVRCDRRKPATLLVFRVNLSLENSCKLLPLAQAARLRQDVPNLLRVDEEGGVEGRTTVCPKSFITHPPTVRLKRSVALS